MSTNYLGIQDIPVTNYNFDKFNIRAYTNILAEFVTTCNTPMTIAIQGDWGCGKTSMMNMVKSRIENENKDKDHKKYNAIWFNTWEYSQFNMAELLPLTFVEHLISAIDPIDKESQQSGKDKSKDKAKNGLKHSILKMAIMGLIEHCSGETTASQFAENFASDIPSIQELKQELQESIINSKKRVIIFVDDFDRIEPLRAIEILEIIKIFFDCKDCVFVLAIDTSIVYQGIRAKYDRNMSDDKAQSYFEKLIQIPYKMPTSRYNYANYLKELFNTNDPDNTTAANNNPLYNFITNMCNDTDSDDYADFRILIAFTTQNNPRNIKRLMNAFILNDKIATSEELYLSNEYIQHNTYKILFALTCLQQKLPRIHSFIVELAENDTARLKNVILSSTEKLSMDTLLSSSSLVTDSDISSLEVELDAYLKISRIILKWFNVFNFPHFFKYLLSLILLRKKEFELATQEDDLLKTAYLSAYKFFGNNFNGSYKDDGFNFTINLNPYVIPNDNRFFHLYFDFAYEYKNTSTVNCNLYSYFNTYVNNTKNDNNYISGENILPNTTFSKEEYALYSYFNKNIKKIKSPHNCIRLPAAACKILGEVPAFNIYTLIYTFTHKLIDEFSSEFGYKNPGNYTVYPLNFSKEPTTYVLELKISESKQLDKLLNNILELKKAIDIQFLSLKNTKTIYDTATRCFSKLFNNTKYSEDGRILTIAPILHACEDIEFTLPRIEIQQTPVIPGKIQPQYVQILIRFNKEYKAEQFINKLHNDLVSSFCNKYYRDAGFELKIQHNEKDHPNIITLTVYDSSQSMLPSLTYHIQQLFIDYFTTSLETT